MLASSSSDQISSEALGRAEPPHARSWAERIIVVAYGSTVSVAMLGWLYALASALSHGLRWVLS